jgi:hypothetical protein
VYDTPNSNLYKTKEKMSRRKNGVRKIKLEKLNEINDIDKKLKRRKAKKDENEFNKLMSRRDMLRAQLK